MASAKQYLTLAFDMCSSSAIVEDLGRAGNLDAFERLVTQLYGFLARHSATENFKIYKFTGDGWILLFPADGVDGRSLVKFLTLLARKFRALRRNLVEGHLRALPKSRGLTFGLAVGKLHRLRIGAREEFLGRSLILACRLQAGVGQEGGSANYRVLLSRAAYNRYMKQIDDVPFYSVVRKLKNLSGGSAYRCKKLNLVPLMRGT